MDDPALLSVAVKTRQGPLKIWTEHFPQFYEIKSFRGLRKNLVGPLWMEFLGHDLI